MESDTIQSILLDLIELDLKIQGIDSAYNSPEIYQIQIQVEKSIKIGKNKYKDLTGRDFVEP